MRKELMTNLELAKLGTPKAAGFKLGIFASVVQGISAVGLMALSAWLISRASQMPPILYLEMAIVGVRGFALGRAFFRYVERVSLHDSAFQMLANLRPRVFAKLIPLAPAGLGASNRTEVLNRLVSDVDEIQNLPLRVIGPVIQSLVVSVFAVGAFSFMVPAASLCLALALLAAAGIAMPLSERLTRGSNKSAAAQKANLSVDTTNFLENLAVIDAFGWSNQQLSKISRSQAKVLKTTSLQSLSIGLGSALFSFLATIATVLCTYFAALTVSNGRIAGEMLAVLALVPIAVFDILLNAQPAIGAWSRYKASAARVGDVLNHTVPKEISENTGTRELDNFESLELRGVAVCYPGESVPVISNVNLNLAAGQSLLLRGKSGKGKSTVANMLVGFLQPSAGQYLLNGLEHDEFSSASIHRVIGYLEQTPNIFMGSLRANLLIGKPDATDSELLNVLQRVKLLQTFESREGLATQLGERGIAISGGEAQRIALARALLADFQVLIFDEPTANLDPETANELTSDLLELTVQDGRKATVFISHSDDIAQKVDSVVQL